MRKHKLALFINPKCDKQLLMFKLLDIFMLLLIIGGLWGVLDRGLGPKCLPDSGLNDKIILNSRLQFPASIG